MLIKQLFLHALKCMHQEKSKKKKKKEKIFPSEPTGKENKERENYP